MRRIYTILGLLLWVSTARAQSYTVVTATGITDPYGKLLATGTLCLLATDSNANLITLTPNNMTPIPAGQKICASVATGTAGTLSVPNSAAAVPAGSYYTAQVFQGASSSGTASPIRTCTLISISGSSQTIPANTLNCGLNAGVYYADQFTAGSSTGGIQEAYSACQANTAQNPTGCKIALANDETINGTGVLTIASGKPLVVDGQGHTINCANTSGTCFTQKATSYNGTKNVLSHLHFVYTGSSSSVTGLEILNTDFTTVSDVSVSGFSTSGSVGLELNGSLVGHYPDVQALGNATDLLITAGANVNTFDGACAFSTSSLLAIDIQASDNNVFRGCDLEGNSGTYTVALDATTGNIVGTVFKDGNYFSTDGDGTITSAMFNFITPSSTYIIGTQIDGNFLGGEASGLGYAYNYSTTGTPNSYMSREGNSYFSVANADHNHPAGNFDYCKNENFTGIGNEPVCDRVDNDHNTGAGSILAESITSSTSNPVTIGTSSLGVGSGRLYFSQQALIAENSSCTSGNVNFGAGWGTLSGCVVSNASRDQAGGLSFVAGNGAGDTSITLTYVSGAWPNAPFCNATIQDVTLGIRTVLSDNGPTSSHAVWKAYGLTPVSGDSYYLQWNCPSGG